MGLKRTNNEDLYPLQGTGEWLSVFADSLIKRSEFTDEHVKRITAEIDAVENSNEDPNKKLSRINSLIEKMETMGNSTSESVNDLMDNQMLRSLEIKEELSKVAQPAPQSEQIPPDEGASSQPEPSVGDIRAEEVQEFESLKEGFEAILQSNLSAFFSENRISQELKKEFQLMGQSFYTRIRNVEYKPVTAKSNLKNVFAEGADSGPPIKPEPTKQQILQEQKKDQYDNLFNNFKSVLNDSVKNHFGNYYSHVSDQINNIFTEMDNYYNKRIGRIIKNDLAYDSIPEGQMDLFGDQTPQDSDKDEINGDTDESIKDTDGDGQLDLFDVEPENPQNAESNDSDGDGIPDEKKESPKSQNEIFARTVTYNQALKDSLDLAENLLGQIDLNGLNKEVAGLVNPYVRSLEKIQTGYARLETSLSSLFSQSQYNSLVKESQKTLGNWFGKYNPFSSEGREKSRMERGEGEFALNNSEQRVQQIYNTLDKVVNVFSEMKKNSESLQKEIFELYNNPSLPSHRKLEIQNKAFPAIQYINNSFNGLNLPTVSSQETTSRQEQVGQGQQQQQQNRNTPQNRKPGEYDGYQSKGPTPGAGAVNPNVANPSESPDAPIEAILDDIQVSVDQVIGKITGYLNPRYVGAKPYASDLRQLYTNLERISSTYIKKLEDSISANKEKEQKDSESKQKKETTEQTPAEPVTPESTTPEPVTPESTTPEPVKASHNEWMKVSSHNEWMKVK